MRRLAASVLSDYAAPPLKHSEELLQSLDQAAAQTAGQGEWTHLSAEIAGALREHGANEFLRLAPIAKTVHPRIRSAGPGYRDYVFRSARFTPALQQALTESPVGKPLLNPYYPLSSPLLMQHAYHLIRLLEATDLEVSGLGLVADFGGGYGSFFRLLRNLGYRGRYLICDLPAMCALQRFYLRNLFPSDPGGEPPANLQWVTQDIPRHLGEQGAAHRPSLFVATWSLSETPPTVREAIAPALGGFTYVLCAYQRAFAGIDNARYFQALERSLPQFTWRHAECEVYRNNFYLIGRRR